MDTIITQKVKEVLKNKIFSVFSQKLYEMINIVFESITSNDVNSRYLSLISNLQNSTRNIIKSTIVSLFEAIDTEYKDSKDRLLYYYISKTNVKRTIITVVGEISFERTYYKDKNTGNRLTADEIQNGHEGDNYITERKTFDDYKLVEVPANADGTLTKEDIKVNYFIFFPFIKISLCHC